MSKEIAMIEFLFENIDYVEIPAEYFEEIALNDIREESYGKENRETLLMVGAANFKLKPSANADGSMFESEIDCIESGESDLFDRFRRQDITQIGLRYKDQTCDNYYVIWKDVENDEYRNQYQSSEILENGVLCVSISEKKN